MGRHIPITAIFNPREIVGGFDGETGIVRLSDEHDFTKVSLALGYIVKTDRKVAAYGAPIMGREVHITSMALVPNDNINPPAIPKVDILSMDGEPLSGFTHGQPVKSVKHNHEEVMTFCCLRPGNPLWAIVIRGEGRLSDYPLADLVAVE